ncbi:MAG: cyclic nucleotide-binding domain-containing protein [Bdellovibrionales bacterium]|jgi:hypothetical protein|nr:cyclic nucleotide-binding domain-containing protein [Bdellovibrionales bacterium]
MGAHLAGHLTFTIIALSFLVKDIFWLRTLSIIASCFSFIYNYFAPASPLWVAISWNAVFISLNIYHLSVLIYEKRSIVMSERDKELYETMFNKLSPVEFMKIIKIGTWASSKPGDILIKQDNDVNSLRLIYSGNVNIEIDGKIVSELKDGNFIGEMSFLTEHKASATVTAKHETECLTWKQEELKILLKRNPSLYFSIQSMLSSQVSMALISSSKKQAS